MKKPPVVAILGHIDHGKTSLLSKIRERDLTKGEFGGITQHIGAYQIDCKGRKITFIDTPGHVAFSKMRVRGVEVTDLVVLVIAANDGVKPQTKESLEHIRAAAVPFLVAINKMDLPQAESQIVKQQLQKEGVLVEDLGGKITSVEISAKTGKGIDELLDLILLLSEVEGFKADSRGSFEAVVIESLLDSRRGSLATLLIKNGTLRVGDEIRSEDIVGKVKAMFDENGERVDEAGPSKPVEVLGFKAVVSIGSQVVRLGKESVISESAEKRTPKVISDIEEGEKKLKIILKSDVQGTLEAVVGSLPAGVQVIFQAVGNINESDILLASTSEAEVIGFNVKIPSRVAKLAKTEQTKVKTYNIIYELLDDLKKKISEPELKEEILGEAKIIAEFEMKKERIAGCRVKKGKISKNDKLRLIRGKKVLGEMIIKSMKHQKEDVIEAQESEEFGALFKPELDFKINDVIMAYNESKT